MIDWGKLVTVEDKAVEALAALKKQVATVRYNNEVKGITVSGMLVDTGRDSQGLIAGACLAAVIDPEYLVNWKCVSGEFLPLNAQQIIGLATAVRAHVQACFNRENELLTAIEDNTFTESMLTEGWPSNE
jgi:predicted glycosyltransferase